MWWKNLENVYDTYFGPNPHLNLENILYIYNERPGTFPKYPNRLIISLLACNYNLYSTNLYQNTWFVKKQNVILQLYGDGIYQRNPRSVMPHTFLSLTVKFLESTPQQGIAATLEQKVYIVCCSYCMFVDPATIWCIEEVIGNKDGYKAKQWF